MKHLLPMSAETNGRARSVPRANPSRSHAVGGAVRNGLRGGCAPRCTPNRGRCLRDAI